MFAAHNNDQKLVKITSADKKGTYYCPHCERPLIQKHGAINRPHFAHRSEEEDCGYGRGETELHFTAKTNIAEMFTAIGCDCATEARLEYGDTHLTADILIDNKFAIEIQRSELDINTLAKRTNAYTLANVPVLWITPNPIKTVIGSKEATLSAMNRYLAGMYGQLIHWQDGKLFMKQLIIPYDNRNNPKTNTRIIVNSVEIIAEKIYSNFVARYKYTPANQKMYIYSPTKEIDVGFEFTEEQNRAIAAIFEHDNVFITGEGGSGKTAISEKVRDFFVSEDIYSTAPTGEAAINMDKNDGMTIHKLFGAHPITHENENEGLAESQLKDSFDDLSFDFKGARNDGFGKILFVDEASMVGRKLKENTLDTANFSKVIYFGDMNQLPPVKDIRVDWKKECEKVVELTHNHRVDDPEVKMFIDQYQIEGDIDVLREYLPERAAKDMPKGTFFIAHANITLWKVEQLLNGKQPWKKGDEVITFSNSKLKYFLPSGRQMPYFINGGVVRIRKFIEAKRRGKAFLYLYEVERTDHSILKTGSYPEVYLGDHNLYKIYAKAEVKAGDIPIPFARSKHFTTVNKAQGKSLDNVALCADVLSNGSDKRIYTALSRARKGIFLVK